ncbi:MAG: hypothetical protein OXH99_03930 [Bryobacterales bacterium]|nr:hypothetical protein [Bryobacterales bacterium]
MAVADCQACRNRIPVMTRRHLLQVLNGDVSALRRSSAAASGRCALGDGDDYGDMDILVMNMNEPPSLIWSDASLANHWLKVELIGVGSNRAAVGARVYERVAKLRMLLLCGWRDA